MIGLTLVTVVAVLGAGMRNTVESAVTDQVDAAYILNGNDGEPFEAAEGDALARVPGRQRRTRTSASTRRSWRARSRTSPAWTRRRSRASTSSTGPTAPTPPSPSSAPMARS